MAFIEMDFASGGGGGKTTELVPTMTSDSATMTVIYSSQLNTSNYAGYFAFDGKDYYTDHNGWLGSTTGKTNEFIGFYFVDKFVVTKYSFKIDTQGTSGNFPCTFELVGCDDYNSSTKTGTWNVIPNSQNTVNAQGNYEYNVKNSTGYKYYAIRFKTVMFYSSSVVNNILKVQFYGYKE